MNKRAKKGKKRKRKMPSLKQSLEEFDSLKKSAHVGKSKSTAKKSILKETPTDTPTQSPNKKRRISFSTDESPYKSSSSSSSPVAKKQAKGWTDKKEQKLCDMWEAEEHLYDTSAKGYRDNRLRVKTIKRFSVKLGIKRKYFLH